MAIQVTCAMVKTPSRPSQELSKSPNSSDYSPRTQDFLYLNREPKRMKSYRSAFLRIFRGVQAVDVLLIFLSAPSKEMFCFIWVYPLEFVPPFCGLKWNPNGTPLHAAIRSQSDPRATEKQVVLWMDEILHHRKNPGMMNYL